MEPAQEDGADPRRLGIDISAGQEERQPFDKLRVGGWGQEAETASGRKRQGFDKPGLNGYRSGGEHDCPHCHTPLRPRHPRWRAQRGQVHARQRDRRAEGRDRQSQGADDARAAARRCHRGGDAAAAGRHARHLRAHPPPGPGDGRRCLGGNRRRGRRRARGRRQGRHRDQGHHLDRAARRPTRTRVSRPQQGGCRRQAPAADPRRAAECIAAVRGNVLRVGGDRRWRARAEARPRGHDAGGAVALSRGSGVGRDRARARRRGHARAAVPPAPCRAALCQRGRDRVLQGTRRRIGRDPSAGDGRAADAARDRAGQGRRAHPRDRRARARSCRR